MNFTVIWLPQAERELAVIWMAATDRNAVSEASNRIDQMLERNPLGVGESRDEGFRVLIERPLGVYYSVDEDQQLVQVGNVWMVRSRPHP